MKEWQELCLFFWVNLQERFHCVADELLPFQSNEPASTAIPRTAMPERDLFGELWHMLSMLGLVFLVLLVLLWLSKRFLASRMAPIDKENSIHVLEKHALSMKSTLYLIEIDGARWLIGESPTELTSFGRLDGRLDFQSHMQRTQSPPPLVDKKEVDKIG